MDINIGGDDEPANETAVFVYDGVMNRAPYDVTLVRVLPNITIIPEGAFYGHRNLLDVELPEGLTKIENFAFSGCRSLKRINFPSTLQEIGEAAFEFSENLSDVVLPAGLRVLGQCAFFKCFSLQSIHIPPNVQMGGNVFHNCEGLTNASFAEGLESIGENAFIYCKSLVSVNLPPSLKVIEESAFYGCVRLSDVKLPDAVETIECSAFSGTSLQTFRIPPLVADVNIDMFDSRMFDRCNCLVSVELSSHVRNINNEGGRDKLLNRLRNIAIPPECTLAEYVDMLEICDDLGVAFPNDEDGDAITDALKHRFDNLPIHKMCYYQSYHDKGTVLSDLKREINTWTSKLPGQLNQSGKQQDCLGMTPLHILACSTRQDVELYRILVESYPETLITKDKWGDIPLLYAFWCNAPDEVIELLVDSYKTNHPDYEFDWRGMLLTLVKAQVPLTNIQKLFSTQQKSFPDQKIQDMEALIMELAVSDTVNKFSISKQTTRNDTFQYLLHISITKRLDKLNVSRWSAELQNCVNTLPVFIHNNRREDTRALYAKLDLYELAKEATSVLELALWKMKIDEIVVSNISDDHSSQKKANIEDRMSPRNQCRINCGAQIIIPCILHYLEPKPGLEGGSALNDAVLNVIKTLGANVDAGVHVDEITAQVLEQGYNEGDIENAIYNLSNEGHIYSTIDENYYQYAE